MDIDRILFWTDAAGFVGMWAVVFGIYCMVVNWMNKVEAILEELKEKLKEIKEKLDKDDEQKRKNEGGMDA